MNLYQIIAISLVLLTVSGTFTNTTDFWQKSLKTDTMHFECYSGYQEIDWYYPKGQSAMYYSLWGATGHSPSKEDSRVPLIIWLQGGPGASSQFGAFTENGPIKVTKDGVKSAGSSWNIMGHMLFIDQPLNVGFSRAEKHHPQVSSARQAADHLLNFLDNFYRQWPATKKSPLYITGESFAGHYIPAFAFKIVENKTFLPDNEIVFGGVAIGDGWTDPYNQVNQYDSYLYSTGIVSNKFRDYATWFQTQAIQHMALGARKNATQFFDFLTNNDDTRYKYWGGMSTFNFRQYGQPDESFITFLNDSRKQFGVQSDTYYVPGNDDVYDAFAEDITRSYAGDVIALLKKNVRVLIYNGQDDFVVNTPGVLNYINGLNWVNLPNWKRSLKQIWTIHGQNAGWVKIYNNFWFVLVNHAGHMVPSDQPERAFNMMGHFLNNHKQWKE